MAGISESDHYKRQGSYHTGKEIRLAHRLFSGVSLGTSRANRGCEWASLATLT